MSRVTIKDVANLAGVSIATVSNALNNSQLVSEDTRQKVTDAVKELNYIPNMSGKLLKSGKNNTITFLTNSLIGPYFYVLIEAMQRECELRGYTFYVVYTRKPQMIRNILLGNGADGLLIFAGIDRVTEQELDLMRKQGIKAIFLDRYIQEENMGSVLFDSYQAGLEMTRKLIRLGHRKIFFIRGAEDVYDSIERMRGYRDALQEANLPFEPEYVVPGMFEELYTYNSVTDLCRKLDSDMPDAFVAGNDLSAIGCMKALRDNGYRVPEDVSVVGFDDIDIAQYIAPSLTTYRQPIAAQGKLAVEVLLNMLDGGEARAVQLSGTPIIRDSCNIYNR